MEIWQAIILGFVQGLTEFLPVSSSGHIAFFQGVFGLNGDNALFFSLILHLGTLVAVVIVFRNDIIALFKKPFKTLGFLVLATIPAGITGILFEYFDADAVFYGKNMYLCLAVFFLLTAAMLFTTEIIAKKRVKNQLPLGLQNVTAMGFAQALAVIPGISRSGSTICAGTVSGANREEVAKFSFLMSIPVIFGGFLVELVLKLKSGELQNDFAVGGSQYGWCVALGFIISAVAGLFAIKVMLKAVKKANFKWFSLYLVLIAITSVVLQFTYFNA